jgi:hypothetical protein
VGLRRHRALLFKVVADCLGIPSRLVRGRYYCGSEARPLQCNETSAYNGVSSFAQRNRFVPGTEGFILASVADPAQRKHFPP